MKKYEKGVLSVEASIVITAFTFFVLFLFNFASIYTAQSVVSHATIQAADAVALESYLRETADEGDAEDIVYLTSQMTDSTSISADSFESLRTAPLPDVAKQKFVTAVSNTESKADKKLESLGVQDGLAGVDFNSSYVDFDSDDVIVAVNYTLDLKFPVFTAKEVTLTKTAKAKTFGDILYGVTTKPNNPQWGITSGDDEVEHGETVVITATPNHGYKFVKWNDGVTDNPRRVLVTEAKKYVAIFEPSGYGVNLKVNNPAWGSASGSGTYENMATATISATPKKHYQFVGWDYDGNGTVDHKEPTRNLVVNKTYTITAIFEPVTYMITVNATPVEYGSAWATNAEGKSGTTIPAQYGSYVNLSASSKSNYYEFENWSNGAKQSNTKVKVEGDTTYTANFKLSTWTVNFYNGSNLYATVTVYKDSSVAGSGKTMPNTSSLSNFARWKTSDGSTFSEKTTVKSDLNVYAEYKCTVTLSAEGGKVNNKTTDTISVEKGKTVSLPTPNRNGHTFKGWYTDKDGKGTKYTSDTTINSNITLYADWDCKHHDDSGNTWYVPQESSGSGGCSNSKTLYRCSCCGNEYEKKGKGSCSYEAWCGKIHNFNNPGKYWCTSGSSHYWTQYGCITCKYCGRCENGGYDAYGVYRSIGSIWCVKHNGHLYYSGTTTPRPKKYAWPHLAP